MEKKMEGKIVEFIEEGCFICAICISEKKNKLHVLTLNNKEMNLSANRILLSSNRKIDLSKPKTELLEILKEEDQKREELKKQVDVKGLWEILKDEEGAFSGEEIAQLVFSDEIKEAHISAVMRALFEDRTYFRLRNSMFLPNKEEEVETILRKRKEEEEKKEWIEKGSKWLRDVLEGKKEERPPFADNIIRLLIELFLYGKEAKEYKVASEIISRAGITDPFQIKDILVRLGVWDEDENIELIRKRIPLSFSSKVIKEAEEIKKRSLPCEGRKDLRDHYIFTIDGEDTRDFDDALSISIEGDEIIVGIHISDVSEWIPPSSAIDMEARKRGVSCYLPRRQIPMLPEELSHEFLSLRKNEDRLAISLFVHMDREGNIKSYNFSPSIIRVKNQLTYDMADKMLEESDEKLNQLYKIALKFRRIREEKGALNISLPEVKIIFGEENRISIKLIPQDTPSHIIVSEFMILYNWLSARMCIEHNIPILFRTQEKEIEVVPFEEGHDKLFYIIQQIRRIGPTIISTSPSQHNVLGLDAYTQVTSPLRRYLDLVVQRQIKNFLLNKKPLYSLDELEEIKREVEPKTKEIQAITRNRIRYWTLKYLSQHIGETFRAVILDELKKRYRIILPDILLICEIGKRSGVILSPGSEIKVRVERSDPWRDIVELEYA